MASGVVTCLYDDFSATEMSCGICEASQALNVILCDEGITATEQELKAMEQELKAFLNTALNGDPVTSCNISKGSNGAPDCAFVELRNDEETVKCLKLNGLKFKESKLKIYNKTKLTIGRPKNYEGPWIIRK